MPRRTARAKAKPPAAGLEFPSGELCKLAVAEIIRDEGVQVRGQLVERHVHILVSKIRNGLTLPPVQVARVEGKLWLVDGFHRCEAAERAGCGGLVDAVVADGSVADAHWWAAVANTRHGLPLRSKDRREVFRRYVKAKRHAPGGKYLGYRDIAREIGGFVAHTTVRNWMQRDYPAVALKLSRAFPNDEPPKNSGAAYPPGKFWTKSRYRAALDQVIATLHQMEPEERALQMRQLESELDEIRDWLPPGDATQVVDF